MLKDGEVGMTGRNVVTTKTIREILLGLSDQELIECLPYIRDENGEKVNLIELKHALRERRDETT